jgi:hypothetical protein
LCSWKKRRRVARRAWRGFCGGPALEEVTEQRAVLVGEPLKRLREVVFQGAGDAIGDAGLIIDETAAHLDELLEGAHLGALGVERLKFLGVIQEQFERELSVGGIVFRAAVREHLAVLGKRGGIDGEQHDEFVLAQRIDDRALGEFQSDGDGLTAKAFAQVSSPFVDGFRAVLEDECFALRATGNL